MRQRRSRICACRPAIDSRSWPGTERASTAFALTINGEFASAGAMAKPTTSRSWIITKGCRMPRGKLPPIHPGEILLEEFLTPLGISQYRLANDTSVPPRRINEIVRGARSITANTALRLARHFGTTDRFWLNLQAHYDLEVEKERLADRLEREVTV